MNYNKKYYKTRSIENRKLLLLEFNKYELKCNCGKCKQTATIILNQICFCSDHRKYFNLLKNRLRNLGKPFLTPNQTRQEFKLIWDLNKQ